VGEYYFVYATLMLLPQAAELGTGQAWEVPVTNTKLRGLLR